MEEKRYSSTTFAATFNLLSQYIKDNNRKPFPMAAGQTPTTMPLLPGAAELDSEEALRKTREIQLFPQSAGFDESKESTEDKSKLTIFYGGKVHVFDSFPAEKAREIMQFASDAQNSGLGPQQASPPTKQPPMPPAEVNDIPLARNNSLRRFLQKRKDRINSRAPYQVSTIKKEKVEEEEEKSSSSTWLGLGPRISSFSSLNSESSSR